MKVAIVGGGMAGCALAFALKGAGVDVVIYEAGGALGDGASGNDVGLYNPRLSALRGAESDYYAAAFFKALEVFPALEDIDFDPRGALHLAHDEKKIKRFSQTIDTWGWDGDQMQFLSAAEASEIAGVALEYDALYLPQSGSVSPRKLCGAYAEGVEVRLGARVERLDALEADVVVLACGPAAVEFAPDLPITGVRGQVSYVRASDVSEGLKCAVCYSGYISPARDGVHAVGSTFQRWFEHSDILPEDDGENLEKLGECVPALQCDDWEVVGHRAAVRATSRDYFPVVGPVEGPAAGHDGPVYVSAAHGSHGILSCLMAGHLLADMILGRDFCLSDETVAALAPERFALREARAKL